MLCTNTSVQHRLTEWMAVYIKRFNGLDNSVLSSLMSLVVLQFITMMLLLVNQGNQSLIADHSLHIFQLFNDACMHLPSDRERRVKNHPSLFLTSSQALALLTPHLHPSIYANRILLCFVMLTGCSIVSLLLDIDSPDLNIQLMTLSVIYSLPSISLIICSSENSMFLLPLSFFPSLLLLLFVLLTPILFSLTVSLPLYLYCITIYGLGTSLYQKESLCKHRADSATLLLNGC